MGDFQADMQHSIARIIELALAFEELSDSAHDAALELRDLYSLMNNMNQRGNDEENS